MLNHSELWFVEVKYTFPSDWYNEITIKNELWLCQQLLIYFKFNISKLCRPIIVIIILLKYNLNDKNMLSDAPFTGS